MLRINSVCRGCCALSLLLSGLASTFSSVAAPLAPPTVQSRAALVVDENTGRVLLAKNARQAYPIASLSKLMTAIVVMENKPRLDQKIEVRSDDRDLLKRTHSRLTVGSVLSRRDMLHIALMSSENRAASALSRAYPGGRPAFVKRMNLKARQLGMHHTHFNDPTGLTPRNISSAVDLLQMFNYAYRFPLIRQFSTDKTYTVFPGEGQLVYRSSDGLINNPTWHIELQKTGFTDEAGHCLLIRTTSGRHTYDIVILGGNGSYTHYTDAIHIKNWLTHLA
ncbi:serine hydrolase [Martelella alba]|uniref:Peptidase S11 n=1 Tax=Martelella alba TaxID=2590451 RepID=A0ABY2SP50_9HYPH|nr:serine hydrolase [Martelella alba]TKI07767.1 peptidase S11 [Martelella alba]